MSPVEIYFNRSQDRFTFKIKSAYYPELLLPKIMKLLGGTEEKITKNRNSKNVPHLKTTEVVFFGQAFWSAMVYVTNESHLHGNSLFRISIQ